MQEQSASIREKYGRKMKFASVICSLLIIVYGGLSVGSLGSLSNPLDLILPLYYM
jgi:uncharacterized membrane protein YuzA (DUF378 family)